MHNYYLHRQLYADGNPVDGGGSAPTTPGRGAPTPENGGKFMFNGAESSAGSNALGSYSWETDEGMGPMIIYKSEGHYEVEDMNGEPNHAFELNAANDYMATVGTDTIIGIVNS